MTVMLMFVLLLVLLAITSYYWGVDSRDNIDSDEWKRREHGWLGSNDRE